jgi:hypothetical protein
MATISFTELLREIGKLRERIQRVAPADVDRLTPLYMRQARALCEDAELDSSIVEQFIADLVQAETDRRREVSDGLTDPL